MSDEGKINVLFCCLGNICRSPMAEAVFAKMVKEQGLSNHFGVIDSCGTADYHEGEEPDLRTVRVCKKHNVPVNHLARALQPNDFTKFDYIFGMDSNNLKNIQRAQPKNSSTNDDNSTIYDPYYIGDHAFDSVFEQCERYSRAFLAHLKLGPGAQL
ncbi:ltp1-protein-tyrosine-phosphatase [Malassezia pachydermatis]|uniref:Ltp1-protein-tyrosine-phosphatase n=1 Tax=Malassezia pachydermatis TaxID=77020 RepID=A0A0M8MS50_9BASI|nr:ltp1-protein-tyrosine-phosphatase [Malassezia pachydermatis]KOS13234.1 ltp1-protein-tyrosine-phosphatase [Malassezia pachydermatis]